MSQCTADDDAWLVNPGLRIHCFGQAIDGAVLELDDALGHTLRLRTSHKVADLLLQLRTDPTAIARWTSPTLPVQDEPIRRFLMEDCVGQRILVRAGEETHAAPQNPRPPYLSAMWTLLSPRIVNPVAAVLQRLFDARALTLALLLIACALWSLFATMGELLFRPMLSATEVLWVGAASAFGILLHEFGHAAAAYRFGARRVSIGVGLYLVVPVAYSDLSEIWRCSRLQRIVVNVAGVLVQGLWLGTLLLAYHGVGQYACLVAASATAVSMLWNLNPFLRMDGYWILADAFGVHDLRARARRELVGLGQRLRRRDAAVPLRPAILVYALLSTIFLGWLLWRALHFLGSVLLSSLPTVYGRIVSGQFSELGASEWGLLTITLGWQMLMVAVAARFLATTPQRLRQFLRDTQRA